MDTLLEKYVETINYWKVNKAEIKGNHPGYQSHHAIPECFQKIKPEFKNEITFELEKLYSLKETVLVPDHVHFELHMLLANMFPERSQEWFKVSHALGWFMGKRAGRHDVTPEEHEAARILKSKAQSTVKGCKHTKEARQNMSAAQNRPEVKAARDERNARPEVRKHQHDVQTGLKRSDETRHNTSLSLIHSYSTTKRRDKISGENSKNARAVNQYTLDMQFIEQFPLVKFAANKTGIDKNGICACCQRRYKQAGGFIWRYADDPDPDFWDGRKITVPQRSRAQAVNCYSSDFIFIKNYVSTNDAANDQNVTAIIIRNRCLDKTLLNGFFFRFAEDPDQPSEHIVPRKSKNSV